MVFATLALTTLALATASAGSNEDWPHLRGPDLDGRASGLGPAGAGPVEIRAVWRAPLGPAYSGVSVAGGRVVTLLSDGEIDHVVALDAESGEELWRTALGPIYLGHDGSGDGPISSPVLGRGSVFAVGPRGRLVALGEATGELLWEVDFEAQLGAAPPEYGFTSTPVLAGDLLIAQVGGSEGRLLCAFDAASGELRWSAGEGAAAYQSPLVMELAGRAQVVVLNGPEILGLAPDTGEVLWTHALGEESAVLSGMAVPIDGQRFCASVNGALAVFSVASVEEGYQVEELLRSRELGRGYAAPVVHDGRLYGFKGDFLSCVDADTGEKLWRSRPPGGRGLIVVDDRLVVSGAQGVVALVAATPEGYVEQTRFQALEHTSYTWPSFAAGRVYVRNSDELACLEVVAGGAAVPVAWAAGAAGGSGFERFAAEVAAADDKRARVDAFLAERGSSPVVDGELVTFLFRGEHEDVAIAGSMIDGSRAERLQRIEGTDLWHRSYRIEPGARWEYRFQVDYGAWRTDPLNPRTSPAVWGDLPVSEVLATGYEEAAHHAEPTGERRGRMESFELAGERPGDARTIQVYLPAGYDEGRGTYPLLLVPQGPDWLERGLLAHSLDNLIGEEVCPLVAVFLTPTSQWWHEAGGTGTEEYIGMLATELVPHLESTYRLSPGPAQRALMGTGGFGLTAIYATVLHPDVFGRAAAQSPDLGDVARHAFFRELEDGTLRDTSYYVDWNRYEDRNRDRGYDFREDGRRLWAALETAGYPVSGGEALDSHGWGSWRSRTDELLAALFPLEE